MEAPARSDGAVTEDGGEQWQIQFWHIFFQNHVSRCIALLLTCSLVAAAVVRSTDFLNKKILYINFIKNTLISPYNLGKLTRLDLKLNFSKAPHTHCMTDWPLQGSTACRRCSSDQMACSVSRTRIGQVVALSSNAAAGCGLGEQQGGPCRKGQGRSRTLDPRGSRLPLPRCRSCPWPDRPPRPWPGSLPVCRSLV